MNRTIVYFDDRLNTRSSNTGLELTTLRYLQEQLKPKNTDVFGFSESREAEQYILDQSHNPHLFICDHNLFFGKEPLLKNEYMYRTGNIWMFYLRGMRQDLKGVPIIIYTDDVENAETQWSLSMLSVPYIACIPKYNYKGPEKTRLKPWEILLQEILHTPPFMEGSHRIEGRQ